MENGRKAKELVSREPQERRSVHKRGIVIKVGARRGRSGGRRRRARRS